MQDTIEREGSIRTMYESNFCNSLEILEESPEMKDILDMMMERVWEPFVDKDNVKPDLTEEEAIANFFLGFFPDIEDPEDLALELSTFLEDLQVHARAKHNQQIVDFCDFFADNADQLAIDLLKAKESLNRAMKTAIENEFVRAEQVAKAYEEADETSPKQQIRNAQDRLSAGRGAFRKTEER